MPIEAFEVTVSQDGQQPEHNAVANAAKYLAYVDTTDTFGLEGDVFDVNIYGGPEERGDGTAEYQDYGIGLSVAVPIPSAEYRRDFEDELSSLAKVESFERVGYQVME